MIRSTFCHKRQSNWFCQAWSVESSEIIGSYSSLCLKTRFWGQNDKNLNNFSVTTDMLFVPAR